MSMMQQSERTRGIALMFAVVGLCFGICGLHRFYLGKPWTALLWFATGGLLGIGQIVDIIRICLSCMNDGEGAAVSRW